jgi:hypothetical protein
MSCPSRRTLERLIRLRPKYNLGPIMRIGHKFTSDVAVKVVLDLVPFSVDGFDVAEVDFCQR